MMNFWPNELGSFLSIAKELINMSTPGNANAKRKIVMIAKHAKFNSGSKSIIRASAETNMRVYAK